MFLQWIKRALIWMIKGIFSNHVCAAYFHWWIQSRVQIHAVIVSSDSSPLLP